MISKGYAVVSREVQLVLEPFVLFFVLEYVFVVFVAAVAACDLCCVVAKDWKVGMFFKKESIILFVLFCFVC